MSRWQRIDTRATQEQTKKPDIESKKGEEGTKVQIPFFSSVHDCLESTAQTKTKGEEGKDRGCKLGQTKSKKH